ncbi:hypothetical protein AMECASPLE_039808, partial [Ameca splendens]
VRPTACYLSLDPDASTNCCSESEKLDLEPLQPRKDPLLQLVSLQKASGCWLLDADLAAVLGKTREEVEKAKPASVGHCLK